VLDDPLYYENGRGGVAVSLDAGEFVIVKTGRKLLLTQVPLWEESHEDLEHLLSPEQVAALEKARAAPPPTEMGGLVNTFRKRRLQQERQDGKARPKAAPRKLSDSVRVITSDLKD